ncbi:MAG: patatin-like phospholipase family protein [bacterium]
MGLQPTPDGTPPAASSFLWDDFAARISDEAHVPATLEEPSEGIGLALSGGGFRATLFHLGVIEALRDSGRIGSVRVITSVSGGSVLAAHLVLNWQRYTGSDTEYASARDEILRFIQSNPRANIIANVPASLAGRLLSGALRHLRLHRLQKRAEELIPPSSSARLARLYSRGLYGRRVLRDLKRVAGQPDLRILACNLTVVGANSYFDSEGYHTDPDKLTPCTAYPIGHAVAASSAYPLLFEAMLVTPESLGARKDEISPTRQALTDGGVYDNLGVHQLLLEADRAQTQGQPLGQLVVSDAGGALDLDDRSPFRSVGTRLYRTASLLLAQVGALHKERIRRHPDLRFIEIRNALPDSNHLPEQAQRRLAGIRTDLDRFDETEVSALINHGYALATRLFPSRKQTPGFPRPTPRLNDRELDAHLSRSARSTPHVSDLMKHRVIVAYIVLFVAFLACAFLVVRRHGHSPHGPEPAFTSIGEFLITPSNTPTAARKNTFPYELSQCKQNMYFVGLVNQYTLSSYSQQIATAAGRGATVHFLLYLPNANPDSASVPQEALEEYVTTFSKYRPHGDNYKEALAAFWREISESPGLLQGKASSPPPQDRLVQRFYSDTPKGWLIVFDAADDFRTAKKIFWYPYLSAAKEMNRPGLLLDPDSTLGQEVLKWLATLESSPGTRDVTTAEIELWRSAVQIHCDGSG